MLSVAYRIYITGKGRLEDFAVESLGIHGYYVCDVVRDTLGF